MAARVNKFQRRPVACAVRDAEARSLLHGKTGPFSRYQSRDALTHTKLPDWPFVI
jgi:hypothetical protein